MSALFDPEAFDAEPEPIIDPRAVECPSCGALQGRACKRPSGHRAMIAHAARIAAARHVAGIADEAPRSLLDEEA